MKKNAFAISMALVCFFFISCNNEGKDSAASIAKKWCDLNGKAHKAEGADKEKAEVALESYEKEMDAKYKADTTMQRQIQEEIEKCEDASEGN